MNEEQMADDFVELDKGKLTNGAGCRNSPPPASAQARPSLLDGLVLALPCRAGSGASLRHGPPQPAMIARLLDAF